MQLPEITMAKKDLRHHIKHVFSALKFSCCGIKAAATQETAFMQEILLLAVVPTLAYFCGVPGGTMVIIIAGWLMVMALELLNMSIEKVCDLVSPDFHPLVKIAKDAGSAAVFMGMLANFTFWGYLVYTYW